MIDLSSSFYNLFTLLSKIPYFVGGYYRWLDWLALVLVTVYFLCVGTVLLHFLALRGIYRFYLFIMFPFGRWKLVMGRQGFLILGAQNILVGRVFTEFSLMLINGFNITT